MSDPRTRTRPLHAPPPAARRRTPPPPTHRRATARPPPRRWRAASLLGAALCAAAACAPPASERGIAPDQRPILTAQTSGTSALLQAVSAVDDRSAWVSGHEGTYARTTDGGATWRAATVPGADTLQFRDVHAVDARTAFLLSAGPGELSRIYRTTDAGETWTLVFQNAEEDAFFDCLGFWDERRGLAFSDAVFGEFIVIVTEDAGETWRRVSPDRLPDARPGEAGFAASGTCVRTGPDGRAWIGTGAASVARVLYTTDYARTWRASPTPVVAGDLGGIFTLAFRDTLRGAALGGDLDRSEEHTHPNAALTTDGGRTWRPGGRLALPGPVYGAAYVPGAASPPLVAVGPTGLDYSHDDGRSWVSADMAAYWAVGFASPGAGWAVGPEGRIMKIEWR